MKRAIKTFDYTIQELESVFNYEPQTGNLIRLSSNGSRSPKAKPGQIAGTKGRSGYLQVGFQKKIYYVHKIVWVMHGGYYNQEIDHIDGDKTNCKIENLRAATRSQNQANTPKHQDNTGSYKGVFKQRNKFIARIRVNNQPIYLGVFKDPIDAAKAYDTAALEHFGTYAFLNFPLNKQKPI